MPRSSAFNAGAADDLWREAADSAARLSAVIFLAWGISANPSHIFKLDCSSTRARPVFRAPMDKCSSSVACCLDARVKRAPFEISGSLEIRISESALSY